MLEIFGIVAAVLFVSVLPIALLFQRVRDKLNRDHETRYDLNRES